nr:MAG TPA: hypothetical protein [Bacteriophage sp.]
MPVMDYIRARVRQPDCLWSVFPDNRGSVFSPMNNQVFPIPGSATGSTDIKDGLLTLTKFGSNDVFDHQQTFNTGSRRVSPGDDAYIASNLDIRGMTPNHTVVMRMGRIPRDRFSGTTVFGFTADRPYVDSSNITFKNGTTALSVGIEKIVTSPLKYGYDVFGTMYVSSHAENSGSYDPDGLEPVGINKSYTGAELDSIVQSSQFTLAYTCDQATKTCCLYFNGDLIGSAHGWSETRNELSKGLRYSGDYGTCRFGAGSTINYEPYGFLIHYGAVFNTVMTPDEIKLMSEN